MTEEKILTNLANSLPDLTRRKLVAFIVSELLEYQDSDIAYDENGIHVVVDRALRFWADWYDTQEDKERINYSSAYTYKPERKRNDWEAFKEEYKGHHGVYPSDYTIESLKIGLQQAEEGEGCLIDEETLQEWDELDVDFDEEEDELARRREDSDERNWRTRDVPDLGIEELKRRMTAMKTITLNLNLGTEVVEKIQRIADRRHITFTEAIQQSILAQCFLNEEVEQGGRILVQDKNDRIKEVVWLENGNGH